MSLDMTAGTKGAHAKLWVAFSKSALALMHANEDPFTLVDHLTKVADAYYDETLGPAEGAPEPKGLVLTAKELDALELCLSGEVETVSGDASHGQYGPTLNRVLKKVATMREP